MTKEAEFFLEKMFLIESFLPVKGLSQKRHLTKVLCELLMTLITKNTKGHTVANLNTSLFFFDYVYVGCLFKTSA